MEEVLLSFWSLVVALAAGVVLVKFHIVPKTADSGISRLVFVLTMPALIFLAMAKADIGSVFSLTAVVCILGTLILFAFFYVIAVKVFHLSDGEQTIGALSVSYINSGNLGIAFLVAITNEPAASAPIMLFQLLCFTPMIFVILDKQKLKAGKSSATQKVKISQILVNSFTQPPIVAVFLGLLVGLSGKKLPIFIEEPLAMFSHCTVPLIMVAMGISLGSISLRELLKADLATYAAVVTRVLLSPIITFLLGHLFGLSPEMLRIAMVMGAFPTGNSVFIFAHRYGIGVQRGRDVVILSTLFSMPVLLAIAAVF